MTVVDAREGSTSDECLISADSHVAITHEQVRAQSPEHSTLITTRPLPLSPSGSHADHGRQSGRQDHETKRRQRAYRGQCRLQTAGLSGST